MGEAVFREIGRHALGVRGLVFRKVIRLGILRRRRHIIVGGARAGVQQPNVIRLDHVLNLLDDRLLLRLFLFFFAIQVFRGVVEKVQAKPKLFLDLVGATTSAVGKT